MKESIDTLGLSKQLFEILESNGIHTLKDLISTNVMKVGTLPGIEPDLREELLEVYFDIESVIEEA